MHTHKSVSRLMSPKQRQALSIAVIVVVVFGLYFFWDYFYLIALGAIVAFLFNPVYKWLLKISGNRVGLSVSLTFLISFITIAVPLTLVLVITVEQVLQMADSIAQSVGTGSYLSDLIQNGVNTVNHIIERLPGNALNPVTAEQPLEWLSNNASRLLQYSVSFMANAAGGVTSFFAKAVVYIFVFISFLRNQDRIVHALKRLNPLGEKATDLYLSRMTAMTSAMVRGQFIIAIIQGLVDAALLWVVGVDYFFISFVVITFLSIIPLGGGILVIPIGLVMILTGRVWQGILLILGHVIIVGNIDNVLRPRFVPKRARLDSALLILSVFAGLGMFGFLGIVIGPVIAIMIVTTIQVYIAAADREAKIEALQELEQS